MSGRQTRGSQDLTHLSVDQIAHLRSRGRGSPFASRSPSPSAHSGVGAAFFPRHSPARQREEQDNDTWADADSHSNTMDELPIPEDAPIAEVRRIAEQARREALTMRTQQDRMTIALENATQIAAAATAALQALSLGNSARTDPVPASSKRKRPDLPAFDKANIHIWIKRVEAAYAREDVTDPKQKFAFLESIIGVNMGPTVNSFMFGEASQANWEAFLCHLKDTFGPTKQMRCSTFLDGVKRDRRRPTEYLALIRDKAKDVTIDDLEKQLVFRGLPQDVQKLIQDKLEGKNALETAQLADQHFDQQGRPLNSEASICNVTAANNLPTAALEQPQEQSDESHEINAVNARRGQSAPRSNNNRYTPAFSPSNGANNTRRRSLSRPGTSPNRRPSGANHPPTTAAPGNSNEMSNCRFHREDSSSSTCVGPNCPRHHTATSCWSKNCSSHSNQGNGRGGRR